MFRSQQMQDCVSALDEAPARDERSSSSSDKYLHGMEILLHTVQELSLARDLLSVQHIVRTAARKLTGCDGATFVLRDGPNCHYVDEDAIAPLWKGKRFPLETCISGWAMLNRQPAVIPDIYVDSRIPQDAYRPTFVKSLVMVPIRRLNPIGAIGNYWAKPRQPCDDDVRLLQALADSTSIALQNVQAYSELDQLTLDQQTTIERLRAANQSLQQLEGERRQKDERLHELQAELLHVSRLSTMGEFASALSHELSQPLTAATTYLQVAQRMTEGGRRNADGPDLNEVIALTSAQMQRARDIIGSMRSYIKRGESTRRAEDLNASVEEATALTLVGMQDHRTDIRFDLACELPKIAIDKVQIQQVVVNLLRNALEAMRDSERRELTIRTVQHSDAEVAVEIRDSGPGLPPKVRERLFTPFVSTKETGMGLGLSLCQSIVESHGGRIWAEPNPGGGTAFHFSISVAHPAT
jgi:signal transduction histidine kinase